MSFTSICMSFIFFFFFFSSRRRHTRFDCDWSSDVCSSDLEIIHLAGRVLERDLDMIEPTLLECCDSPLIEAHAGSNQVRVIAEPAGLGDQDFQVRPHQRFSSRKSKLSCAEFTSLPQNAQPILSRHLL